MPTLSGNRGEWGEIYIFFKILTDKRIYTADAEFNKLEDIFLDVLSIIREEQPGEVYNYNTGDVVVIKHNDKEVGRMSNEKFVYFMQMLWKLISENENAVFSSSEIEEFLNSIYIYKLTSPAVKVSTFWGGTADIMLKARDKDACVRIMGFSCKTDLKTASTLLNASGDNTNFVYELSEANDDVMNHFNSLFDNKGNVATRERMSYLKDLGIDINFVRPFTDVAYSNLIISGGTDLVAVLGSMIKYFYFEKNGSRTSVNECIDYLVNVDPAGYNIHKLETAYRRKVSNFLYDCFTGMKFGKDWTGRSQCTGGFIVLKRDGDVVAYHSTIADEFKDFLIDKMNMEAPSHKRHKDMVIYKDNDKYYLKLALQLRFQLSR